MKQIKQITSLVLAFLMVYTSIAWNGLQVVQAESTIPATFEMAYNGANGIVSMTYDDGHYESVKWLSDTLKTYGLRASTMMITSSNFSSDDRNQEWRDLFAESIMEPESHSYSHICLPGKWSGNYATSSGNNTDANYQQEIAYSKTMMYETLGRAPLCYAPSNNTLPDDAIKVVEQNYYAMRGFSTASTGLNTNSGERWYNIQSLDPTVNETYNCEEDDNNDGTINGKYTGKHGWYNLYRKNLDDEDTADTEGTGDISLLIKHAAEQGGWFITYAHGVYKDGTVNTTLTDKYEVWYKQMQEYQDKGMLWVTTFGDATRYIRERQNSTVTAVSTEEGICVNVVMSEKTEDGLDLPNEIFNHPLTVKVEVDSDIKSVSYKLAEEIETSNSFVEDGKTYVYANIIPNSGDVLLSLNKEVIATETYTFYETDCDDESMSDVTTLEGTWIATTYNDNTVYHDTAVDESSNATLSLVNLPEDCEKAVVRITYSTNRSMFLVALDDFTTKKTMFQDSSTNDSTLSDITVTLTMSKTAIKDANDNDCYLWNISYEMSNGGTAYSSNEEITVYEKAPDILVRAKKGGTTRGVHIDKVEIDVTVPKPDVAEVGEVPYKNWDDAYNTAIATGADITLLDTVEIEGGIMLDGIDLDLAGNTLSADYLAAFAGANVIDSTGDGLLSVSDGKLMLQEDNTYMPVYDVDGVGYRFAKITNDSMILSNEDATEDYISFIQKPIFGSDINVLVSGEDARVRVGVRLSWNVYDENNVLKNSRVQDCYFTKDDHAYVYDTSTTEKRGFTFSAIGFEGFCDIKATPIVLSEELGVVYMAEGEDPYGTKLPYEPVVAITDIITADWTEGEAAPIEWRNVKPTAEGEATVANYLNNMTSHPRILVSEWDTVAAKIPDNLDTSIVGKWYKRLTEAVKNYLAEAEDYTITAPVDASGNKISPSTTQIRRARNRIETLSFVYKIEQAKKKAGRDYDENYESYLTLALSDMTETIASWKDWHGYDSCLMSSELLFGYACAYDWLYDDLTPIQRNTIYEVAQENGLAPLVCHYEHETFTTNEWTWDTTSINDILGDDSNWNPVCNGSAIAAAVAFADEKEDVAGYILEKAPVYLGNSLNEYAPQGAYLEGVSYWDFGTAYLIFAADTLKNGFNAGTMAAYNYMDKEKYPYMEVAGDFPLYFSGTTNMFNYGDCNDGRSSTMCFYWLANQFNRPWYTWYENTVQKSTSWLNGQEAIAALCFYDTETDANAAPTELDKFYGYAIDASADAAEKKFNGMSMRSAWDDNALYVAMQGGHNESPHQHLSLGTYVIDWQGERFISLLSERRDTSYKKYETYHTRAEAYNTFLINPTKSYDQYRYGYANLLKYGTSEDTAYGVLDMSNAHNTELFGTYKYKPLGYTVSEHQILLDSAKRGLKMTDSRSRIIVQDEVALSAEDFSLWNGDGTSYYWFANTDANIYAVTNGVADTSAALEIGDMAGQNILLEMEKKDDDGNVVSKHYMLAHIIEAPEGAQFEVVEANSLFEDVNNCEGSKFGTKKLAIRVENEKKFTLAVEYIALDGEDLEKEISTADSTSGCDPLDEW